MAARTDAQKRREAAQRYAGRSHNRSVVKARFKANGERCEGCGRVPAYHETAHLFGRRHRVKEPYASWPELCAELCSSKSDPVGCHEKIDRYLEPDLRYELELRAVQRLAAKMGQDISDWALENYATGLLVNMLIDRFESEQEQ